MVCQYNSKVNISVILVAYHGDRWIPQCINTLRQATKNRFRLLLVDNARNSCIDDLDFSDFDATILKCKNPLGFSESNNYALVNGGLETEFVCFLNQDTLSTKGWLDSCVQCLSLNCEIGAITPLVSTYDGQRWDQNFLESAYLSEEFIEHWQNNKKLKGWYPVPRIPAVAMVARTDIIKRVGPFDPIYESYYEDYDLCERIKRMGYILGICTHGKISHFSGSATFNTKKEKKRLKQIIRNRAIAEVRYSPNRVKCFFKNTIINFPRRLFRSILNRPSSQPIAIVLKAWYEYTRLFKILVSERIDRLYWEKYLKSIKWYKRNHKYTD